MSSLFGALIAISEILKAFMLFVNYMKEKRGELWYQDVIEVFGALNRAKTSDERSNAAKRIQDLIGRM